MQNRIIQAAHFAREAHKNQTRKYSGDPYIFHPMRVASKTMMLYYSTEELVCAAYLHDVIEDCGVTQNEIDYIFGSTVGHYVSCLTNVSKKHPEYNREQRKRMDREHLALIPRECRSIKLIDRIDNCLDIPWNESFAKLYFEETKLLLGALRNSDPDLVNELSEIITKYENLKLLSDNTKEDRLSPF
jgi:(p)ppGpp synthase/HD superfamily hydrolase